MNLDSGTVAIIQLAWSRLLKMDDSALASAGGTRVYRVDNSARRLTFVRLFGEEALVGPDWAVDAARQLNGSQLSRHSTLLNLSRHHGGRALGEANLYFCDALPAIAPRAGTAVTGEASYAVELERLCPPDDTAEVGLSTMEHRCVLVDDTSAEPAPLAGAGWDLWGGILAHMGTLTAPEQRRQGYARHISSIAVEEAMAVGLIPQWRARIGNAASHQTALSAGFVEAGTQTSVLLEP